MEASVIVNDIKSKKGNFGFDARAEKFVDMIKSGIIDPTLVTRTAVQNAASIAGLLLTTEAVITDMPEPSSNNPPAGIICYLTKASKNDIRFDIRP